MIEEYDEIINEHIREGYVKRLFGEYTKSDQWNVWWLPHHPLFNPKKSDKVRIVFDYAAEYQGVSSNVQIYQGPKTTGSPIGILLMFRRYKVALAFDVEEMFLQVRVPEQDREVLRFLWWLGRIMMVNPAQFQLTVHPFGMTSSPFCANFAHKKSVLRI